MIEKFFDPNKSDLKFGDALQAAASENRVTAMVFLLEHGVDVEGSGGVYGRPLHAACFAGHIQAVKLLLDHDANINSQGSLFRNVLQAAVPGRREEVVKLRLIRGATVSSLDAQMRKFLSILKMGYKRPRLPKIHNDFEEIQHLKVGSLEIAASTGNLGVVRILAAAVSDETVMPSEIFDIGGDSAYTALQIAAFCGHTEVVDYLLRHGADPNTARKTFGFALQTALKRRHFEIAAQLLEYGALIDKHCANFGSCFQIYCERGDLMTVQFLLDHGCDIEDCGGSNGNALQVASDAGNTHIVKYLIDQGARGSAPGRRNGNALQAASARGRADVVDLLLVHGAEVNAHGGRQGSALQRAAANGHLQVAQTLLQHGAAIVTNDRKTAKLPHSDYYAPLECLLEPDLIKGDALRAAAIHRHYEIVRLLLAPAGTEYVQYGGLIRAYRQATTWKSRLHSLEPKTTVVSAPALTLSTVLLSDGIKAGLQQQHCGDAIHTACKFGDYPAVKILLSMGVDANRRCSKGRTPIYEAAEHGYKEIVRLLIEQGAQIDVLTKIVRVRYHVSNITSGNEVWRTPCDAAISSLGMYWARSDDGGEIDLVGTLELLIEAGADLAAVQMPQGMLTFILEASNLQNLQHFKSCTHGVVPERGQPAFSDALEKLAKRHRPEMLEYMLKDQVFDDDFVDVCGRAVKSAASNGCHDALRLLLKIASCVNGNQKRLFAEAMSLAVEKGHQNIVKLLLEMVSSDELLDNLRYAVLHRGRHTEMNITIFDLAFCCTKMTNRVFQTFLNRALESDSPCYTEAMEYLLPYIRKIIDEDETHILTANLDHLLLHFCSTRHTSVLLDNLLSKGANPNTRNAEELSPLYLVTNSCGSVSSQQLETRLSSLLAYRAEINTENGSHGTALQVALHKRCGLPMIEILVAAGASVDAISGHYGTALQAGLARPLWFNGNSSGDESYRASTEATLTLLRHGADVNLHAGHFGTALQAAADSGNAAGVQLLLEWGADPNAQCGYHGSALRAAQHTKHTLVEKILLGAGAVDLKGPYPDCCPPGDRPRSPFQLLPGMEASYRSL